jgi:hypothetical protein
VLERRTRGGREERRSGRSIVGRVCARKGTAKGEWVGGGLGELGKCIYTVDGYRRVQNMGTVPLQLIFPLSKC